MISFKTIKGGGGVGDAVSYHDKAFANDGRAGADNYYANEKAGATWGGRGAVILGISGQGVSREAFANALSGKLTNPMTGEIQDLSKGVRDRRHGYDLTIAPSKSVSVMALVGGDQRIIDAHRNANEAAMQWVEKYASVARVKTNGQIERVTTGNLLYATVVHHTNRTEEPQIHSHNVVMSATYDTTGEQWRSLTNDQLMRIRRVADKVYQHTLATNLKDLGYKLDYNDKSFEIAGFSKEQLAAFSKRSAGIDEKLREWGLEPEKATYEQRQNATLATREAKKESTSEVLQDRWKDEARNVGIDVSAMKRDAEKSSEKTLPRAPDAYEKEAGKAVAWAIEHLSEREQAFPRVELSETALKFVRGKAVGVEALETAIDRYLERGVLAQHENSELLTTHRAKTAEQTLLSVVENGKGNGRAVLSSVAEFDAALQAFEKQKSEALGVPFKLTGEQIVAAQNLLLHPDQVQGIQGDAGTGKTAALEFVRGVAEARGWTVSGVATSASAAKELEQSSGIPSQTVAMFQTRNAEQIQSLTAEIVNIKAAIARDGVLDTGTNRIERHRLDTESGGRNVLYTFDHQRGDVYRTPDTLRNTVGQYLIDLSKDAQVAGDGSDRRTLVSERWGAVLEGMEGSARKLAGNVGTHLVSYEPVSFAEAVNARAALAAKSVGQEALLEKLQQKETELVNIKSTGNALGAPTLLVMDEATLTGAGDMARVTSFGASLGARMVLQGDIKQHESVAAGRSFWQAQQAGMNTSHLVETRRFDHATPQVKESLALIGEQRFGAAVAALDRVEVSAGRLATEVASIYVKSHKELAERGVENPSVGVVALTNRDRKDVNVAIHEALKAEGKVSSQDFTKIHLDDPKLTEASRRFVDVLRSNKVDALVFSKSYREISVNKGDMVRVIAYDVDRNRVTVETPAGKRIEFDPQRQDFFKPYVMERRDYSAGDQVQARAVIKLDSPSKGKHVEGGPKKVDNGTRGTIVSLDKDKTVIEWGADRVRTVLTNDQVRSIDHAYARTSYIEQGATNHRELFAISNTGAKIVDRQAIYVALSRAKDNTILVTSDFKSLVSNADEYKPKTTALGELSTPELSKDTSFSRSIKQEPTIEPSREVERPAPTQVPEKSKTNDLSR
jgi:conjugative relaxase-like TrwC/TraI family protein